MSDVRYLVENSAERHSIYVENTRRDKISKPPKMSTQFNLSNLNADLFAGTQKFIDSKWSETPQANLEFIQKILEGQVGQDENMAKDTITKNATEIIELYQTKYDNLEAATQSQFLYDTYIKLYTEVHQLYVDSSTVEKVYNPSLANFFNLRDAFLNQVSHFSSTSSINFFLTRDFYRWVMNAILKGNPPHLINLTNSLTLRLWEAPLWTRLVSPELLLFFRKTANGNEKSNLKQGKLFKVLGHDERTKREMFGGGLIAVDSEKHVKAYLEYRRIFGNIPSQLEYICFILSLAAPNVPRYKNNVPNYLPFADNGDKELDLQKIFGDTKRPSGLDDKKQILIADNIYRQTFLKNTTAFDYTEAKEAMMSFFGLTGAPQDWSNELGWALIDKTSQTFSKPPAALPEEQSGGK